MKIYQTFETCGINTKGDEGMKELPESKLVKKQKKNIPKFLSTKDFTGIIIVNLRYDDECGNGHNTFSVTADMYEATKNGKYRDYAFGMLKDEIRKHFPEYEKYLKWHLCSSDGPMHYIANTLYHASDKDCWGGKKGEVRWYRYNVKVNGGLVFAEDVEPYKLPDKKEAMEIADRIGGVIVPVPWVYHEGKDRELDWARDSAIWPDATDEELLSPDLKEKLEARLPALMLEFKAMIEELGFEY